MDGAPSPSHCNELTSFGHLMRNPTGHVAVELFQARQTRSDPGATPRRCSRAFISHLACERLGTFASGAQEELGEVDGEEAVWTALLNLLLLHVVAGYAL